MPTQEMNDAINEGRLKVVYLDERLIVNVLNWANTPKGFSLTLPVNCGLPTNAWVERTWSCPDRRAIGALVAHPSFEPVPCGEKPPEHPGNAWETECVVIES